MPLMRIRSSFAVPDAAFIAVPTLERIAVDVLVKLDFAALTARFAANQVSYDYVYYLICCWRRVWCGFEWAVGMMDESIHQSINPSVWNMIDSSRIWFWMTICDAIYVCQHELTSSPPPIQPPLYRRRMSSLPLLWTWRRMRWHVLHQGANACLLLGHYCRLSLWRRSPRSCEYCWNDPLPQGWMLHAH